MADGMLALCPLRTTGKILTPGIADARGANDVCETRRPPDADGPRVRWRTCTSGGPRRVYSAWLSRVAATRTRWLDSEKSCRGTGCFRRRGPPHAQNARSPSRGWAPRPVHAGPECPPCRRRCPPGVFHFFFFGEETCQTLGRIPADPWCCTGRRTRWGTPMFPEAARPNRVHTRNP